MRLLLGNSSDRTVSARGYFRQCVSASNTLKTQFKIRIYTESLRIYIRMCDGKKRILFSDFSIYDIQMAVRD